MYEFERSWTARCSHVTSVLTCPGVPLLRPMCNLSQRTGHPLSPSYRTALRTTLLINLLSLIFHPRTKFDGMPHGHVTRAAMSHDPSFETSTHPLPTYGSPTPSFVPHRASNNFDNKSVLFNCMSLSKVGRHVAATLLGPPCRTTRL